METTLTFDLAELDRDWVVGPAGGGFRARVEGYLRDWASQPKLRERGVCIAERDPVAFSAAFLAAVHAGIPAIVANPDWGEYERRALAGKVSPGLSCGGPAMVPGGEANVRPPQPGQILIPTGGTTGGMKLAIHDWASLTAAADGLQRFLGGGPIHSICALPLYHVSGLMQLVRSLRTGGRILFAGKGALERGDFWASLEAGAFYLSLVPTQLQRLMNRPSVTAALRRLRALFLGGAGLSEGLAEAARGAALPLMPSYGMTETAAMVAAQRPGAFLADGPSAGHCLPHATLDILDATGTRCADGAPGTVRIRSAALFKGYHGGPTVDLSGGFWTDDSGVLDGRGALHLKGRKDRLVISGGEKIDPAEVEAAALSTGLAASAFATGWPDAEWGERLVLFYVPRSASGETVDWRALFRARLAPHKRPKQVIPVRELPLDERGKPDRKQILGAIGTATDGR